MTKFDELEPKLIKARQNRSNIRCASQHSRQKQRICSQQRASLFDIRWKIKASFEYPAKILEKIISQEPLRLFFIKIGVLILFFLPTKNVFLSRFAPNTSVSSTLLCIFLQKYDWCRCEHLSLTLITPNVNDKMLWTKQNCARMKCKSANSEQYVLTR